MTVRKKATKNERAERTKYECPISRSEFNNEAKPLAVTIGNGTTVAAQAREFSSGSFGWYASDKVVLNVNGTPVKVQVGLNMVVVGSKESA